jgi:hypothetical protein
MIGSETAGRGLSCDLCYKASELWWLGFRVKGFGSWGRGELLVVVHVHTGMVHSWVLLMQVLVVSVKCLELKKLNSSLPLRV